MKAVIYARYSSDNQREESIEGQLRECTAYCQKNDISIVRTYIDRALSAKTDNRPDFQRMIKDSAKGAFDVVLVWKLDRFARNRYDSARYKAQLKKYGVKVLSATENISEGPEGIILESLLEGMAEYYSAELAEKVIRGHTENALKCKYNGGTPTFGYTIDSERHYQIDPRTAPVVLEIFTRYDNGATMKEIRDYLNDTGVTTVRGKVIDLNFVAAILHNRKFLGEYKYRDIVIPNGIPTIVPQDLFDRVQEKLAKNKKAPARHKAEDDYLLTTKLFCGTCGAMMVGESGTSSSKGRKYHYYRCVNTKKNRTCNAKHKSVKKLPLENAVVNSVMAKILDDNFVEYITDTVMDLQGRESSALPALRKQLEDAECGITNMLNAIQAGIINASTKQRLDELEDAKQKIELQIIQVWGDCKVYEYKFTGSGSSSHPASSVQKIVAGELTVETITQDKYELIVKKIDSTNPNKGLRGAGFHVQSENGSFSQDVITGSDGTYTLKDLNPGTYAVTETIAPDGYEIDNAGPQYVTLPSNGNTTVTVTFKDTPPSDGEGSIRKVDADDPTIGLAGAVVKIEGVDNNFTGTYTSGPGGYFTDIPWDSMPVGSYTATEVTPPEGYSLSPDPSKVRQSFYWDGQTDVALIFENDAKVKIELLKLNDIGMPLSGAVFNILKDGQIIETKASDDIF